MSNEDKLQNNKYWKNEKIQDRCVIKSNNKDSCFPKEVLIRIGNSLNIKNFKNHNDLIKKIKQKLNCNDNIDKCIGKSINKNLTLKYLKAEAPKYIWLSNLEIDDVLKNWENKYSNFKAFDTTVNDFQDINNEFKYFNIRKYQPNYNKLCIILNTANSNESGEHWVSLFINLQKNYIAYFDSTGDLPSKDVFRFMKKVNSQCNNINIPMNIYINKKEHQKGDGECGIYSLNFIVECLNGKNPKKIFNKVINDKSMAKNRGVFFRSRY